MKGFTLIEIIIVIGIVSLVLLVGAVKFNYYMKDEIIDKAIYKLKYDISYVQNKKINDTQDYKIEINLNNKSYTCFLDKNNDNIPTQDEVLVEPSKKTPMTYQFEILGTRKASDNVYKDIELDSVEIYNQMDNLAVNNGRVILFVDKYGALKVWNSNKYEDISSNKINKIMLKNGSYVRSLRLYPLITDMTVE